MNKFQFRIVLFWLIACVVILFLPSEKQYYQSLLKFKFGKEQLDINARRAQVDAKVERMLDSMYQEELRTLIAEVNAWEGDPCFLDSIAIIEEGIPLDIQEELKNRVASDSCIVDSNFTFMVMTRIGI